MKVTTNLPKRTPYQLEVCKPFNVPEHMIGTIAKHDYRDMQFMRFMTDQEMIEAASTESK